MGATEILASYAADLKYEDLPEPVVEQAKRIILDTMGCMIGGVPLPLGKSIIELAQEMGGGAPEATIVGSGTKVSAVAAAYANGALSDVLDWNDMLYVGHPATAAVSAGLAMAEREGASGKRLIEAVVAAYEVFGRIGICVQPSEERQQALWGMLTWIPFNAAVATGKILGLDGAQMATAIGTAGAFAPLGACWKYVETRSDTYHYNHGMTAMSGLFAAMHAHKGLTGMNTILEGPTGFWVLAGSDQCDFDRLDALLTTLGQDYWIMQTLYKRWPANLWVQSYLDVFTDLIKQDQIAAEDIEEINVSPALAMLMTYRANGTMDAAFSLAYALAIAAFEPEPGTHWYADENMHSPKVLEMVKKVKKAEGAQDADLNHEFRNYWNGYWMPVQVEIVTKGNARVSGHATYPKGHPANPLSHDDLQAKFRHAASSVLQQGRIEEIIAMVKNLEAVTEMDQLAGLLQP
ncbi:MAG: MmgE/PrpD family protein [Alphaproteobacteria bacterium]|nr:MmgE/PrpD family protein [Alphaproteobacteria bacterium]